MLTPEYLQKWRTESVKILTDQEEILINFQRELQLFENRLDNAAKDLISQYKPILEECNVDTNRKGILDSVLNNPIKKYSQTERFIAGKRSIMLIPSQISRNRFITNRIGEFIELILSFKSENQVFTIL